MFSGNWNRADKEQHMFLEKSRSRIEREFDVFCREFPRAAEDICRETGLLEDREAIALKYLYTNMPLSDVGNYPVSTYLDYVRQGVHLFETSPYIKNMPEEIFLNYVLFHRVNEEEIRPCRTLFGKALEGWTEGLSMAEAALKVNQWCCREVTYHCTDDRTSSALAAYLCGFGRCGEESVFGVNAFRSIGIPARQVYAPKWSHCDDNHAWVEVWCDGQWRYLGACEPEAVLDKGWFNNAASRAMMVHSRWFETGPCEGEEAGREGITLMENQLFRYARTKTVTVAVKDQNGNPVQGASVRAEVMNYGEFSPIARLTTDDQGKASLTTGLGSLHFYGEHEGSWGECLGDTREKDSFECILDCAVLLDTWTEFAMTAPEDTAEEPPAASKDQEEENARFIREAQEHRNAKTEAYCPDWEKEFLPEEKERQKAFMSVLSEKDRIDARPEVLNAHYRAALKYEKDYPADIFLSYIWNPRIADEVLGSWREEISSFFTEEDKENFRKKPEEIWRWIDANIQTRDARERQSVYTAPAAALRLKFAGDSSKRVLFVAVARTLGIPARLNSVDGAMEYREKDAFVPVLAGEKKDAVITLTEDQGNTWIYFQNWSLAKKGKNGYKSLRLGEARWENGQLTIEAEPGLYRLLTANRLPTGNIYAFRYDFHVGAGEKKCISMKLREASLKDMLDCHTIPEGELRDLDGKESAISELTKEKGCILFWLEVGKEPTEHILNELMGMSEEFSSCQDQLVFMIREEKDVNDPTFKKCREALGDVRVFLHPYGKELEMTARKMYVNPDNLPLLVVTGGERKGIFAASGYSVGMADMLLRVLRCGIFYK